MITYEQFKEIIIKYIHFAKCEDNLRKMNIDIFESPLFDTVGHYLDWLWEAYFDEYGIDSINWFLFEHRDLAEDFDEYGNCLIDEEEPAVWDKNDNPIPMRTIEDLWEDVKDHRRKFEKTDKEQLTETITGMIKAQLEAAMEPANIDTIKEAVGDTWEELIKFFNDVDKLVCVDNTDKAIADIMITYIEHRAPYIDNDAESCRVQLFLDTNVGPIMVLSAEDFELYVWQGQ